jgi:hypothetical protein
MGPKKIQLSWISFKNPAAKNGYPNALKKANANDGDDDDDVDDVDFLCFFN